MEDISEILETLRINTEISRKFFEIETNILSILNFKDLFQNLLSEIQEKFGVPFAWISLVRKSTVSDLIFELAYTEILEDRLSFIDREKLVQLLENGTKPILANLNIEHYHGLFPQNEKYPMGSLAIIPLTLDGEIIGSLNQGDYSESRYVPGMDTALLEQLGVKVSICLSNVMAHEKLRALAYWDPLTGVLNRRAMARVLEREFKRSERYGVPLSVAFLDLDGFKQVNDRYGHDIGDRLLIHVSAHLKSMIRQTDIVARFAGDEFVVILPNTALKYAHKSVERYQSFLHKNPLRVGSTYIPISISSGLASTEDTAITDGNSLLKKADQILYQAKELKKNRKDPR
jgi:diguanylate cyclase (GGDEF)-like protein